MKLRRLTIFSLLCAFVAMGADLDLPVGRRFPASQMQLGPKGAVLLFDGSKTQTAELESHREAFHKLGVDVALRSEAGSGWMVLDGKGVIVAKYSAGYTSAAILVERFGWTPSEAPKDIEGKQLTASLRASNPTVAPGERIALLIDVDLDPGMHVYAPGVEGYIPIDWKMEDSTAVEVHAPQFPRSEKLYLKAIDETVPAFRNHFRLTRDITVKPPADGAKNFSVDGSLRYQACDDRVCYIPQTLKLQWTFEYQEPGN